jgi:tRNA threonylcarbamoyladenosine biosynthesis protein TsaB
MSVILCIETSSTNCSVALATAAASSFKNTYGIVHCLDLIEDQSTSYSHGEKLHVFIQDILAKNNLTPKDLSAIAVSAGPGSYTGLRIGVASAKGLCYALDIPLLAIPTLQGIAQLDTSNAQVTIPMLDARRMEVYAAVFKGKELLEDAIPVALALDSFSKHTKQGSVAFIGTGTEKFKNLIGKSATTDFIEIQPTALTLCDLAVIAYKKSDTVDVAYFEPLYLKEFKAI